MGFITIQYEIMEQGSTNSLMNDRIKNPDIFNEYDDETLLEEKNNHSLYYKVKYIKYPKIGIDVEGLSKWAKDNNYSNATDDEKENIRWNGTKEHLQENMNPKVMLRIRLTKWAESKRIIDTNTGLVTAESPSPPPTPLFYKILDYDEDKYEWIFPDDLVNTKIYTYNRIWRIDSKTMEQIEPHIIV